MRRAPPGIWRCTYSGVPGIIRDNHEDMMTNSRKLPSKVCRRGRTVIVDFPRLEASSSLLSACGRAARWQTALLAFGEMHDWGPKPDVAACGALLDAFARAGLWLLALNLLNKMACTSSLPKPDIAAYTAAISACAAAYKWEQAISCLLDMREQLVPVSAAAYNAAALACERAVQVQPLVDLVDSMRTGHLQPDSITFLALTSALGKGHQWEQALGEFARVRSSAVQPSRNLVNSAITACEKGHAWLSAVSVFRELRTLRITPNVVSSSATITAAAGNEEWLPALRLLDSMRSWQVQPDTIAWNSMLDAAQLSSQWEFASELLGNMASGSGHVGVLALLAAAVASENAEHPDTLLRLISELKHQSGKELRSEACKQRGHREVDTEPSSLSHLIEVHELLMTHGAASSELQEGTATAIFRPCLTSLQGLCDHGVRRDHTSTGSQLWEPVLERQFSLGGEHCFRNGV